MLFGVGMSLAGGCANKNLIRVGGGSVRSLVVLAFLAHLRLHDAQGPVRPMARDACWTRWRIDLGRFGLKDQSLASMLAQADGWRPKTALLALTGGARAGAAGLRLQAIGASAATRAVVGGAGDRRWSSPAWYLTGHLGFGENPETLEMVYFATNTRTLESMSFVAPPPTAWSC